MSVVFFKRYGILIRGYCRQTQRMNHTESNRLNNIAAVIGQIKIYWQMTMPENKIIKLFLLQYFFAVSNQPFFVFSKKSSICLPRGCTTATAHVIGNTNTHCWW